MSNALPHKVALIDYDEILFTPLGFEADLLAEVGARWETARCRTADEVVAMAADADVVVVQSVRPLLTREVIDRLPRCRCMIRAGAGYDSIDYEYATQQGIMVCNTPTYCTDDVADHAVSLMLACVRHLPRLDAAMRRGRYARELARPTRRMRGTTLGLIGLGRIGATVARNVSGWDMRVLVYDPYVSPERVSEIGAELVGLDELLEAADFISIHCLLSKETHHLLSWEQFARAKPGLIVVNTARGPIIDEEALVAALKEGRVWAAGLDVTEKEPLPADSPLLGLDNVILTPHVAANTPEGTEDLYRIVCRISADVIQGRVPEFVVNPQALNHPRQAPAT
jgi:D-3-phosphoglycerate dehydrogenase